jgi:hypothetical protein
MNNNYEEENNNIKPLYRKVYDLPPQEEDLEHYMFFFRIAFLYLYMDL